MDDPEGLTVQVGLLVREVQPLAHQQGDVGRVLGREVLAALGELAQDALGVLALHTLHGEEVLIADAAEVVDLDDVRVLQLDGDLGFVDEHLDELIVVREVLQDALDDEELLEAAVREALGLEHLRHSADGDFVDQEVSTKGNGLLEVHLDLSSNALRIVANAPQGQRVQSPLSSK